MPSSVNIVSVMSKVTVNMVSPCDKKRTERIWITHASGDTPQLAIQAVTPCIDDRNLVDAVFIPKCLGYLTLLVPHRHYSGGPLVKESLAKERMGDNILVPSGAITPIGQEQLQSCDHIHHCLIIRK